MLSETIKDTLLLKYPEFEKDILKMIKHINFVYDEYINETKFVYDKALEEFQSDLETNQSDENIVDKFVKIDEDYRNSDFGKGDHIVNYISDTIADFMLELDRRQNLKDY